MVVRKRILLWDWTNTSGPGNPGVPQEMNNVPFGGNSPMSSVINWNVWVPPELKGRAPFRPMVRTMGQTTGGDWGTIENTPYNLILFFNEPERAGISPEQARDIWYKQMLPLRHNKAKKLGSPAVASDANGQKWIDQWMKLVANDPPDYLCLHYYSTNADSAIKYISDMHNKHPKHPVMVTEIACIDRNYNNVLNFSIKICNWMDQQSWIFEYGLFDFQRKVADGFVSPAAQLMDPNGHFTQLGVMYLHDQPMHQPAKPHAVVQMLDLAEDNPAEVPTPPQHGPEDEIHHGPPPPSPAQEPITESVDEPTTNDPTTNGTTTTTVDDSTISPMDLPPTAQFGFSNHSIQHATAALNSDQLAALKIHNDGRRSKGLQPLQWDNNLAAHAQNWANNLVKLGRLQHSTGDQRPGEGENLAFAWSSGGIHDPLAGGARMWMNEAKDYHGEPIGQGDFAKYGHYTQCMWKSTTKVGMAFAKDSKGAAYTVGRYSPPGNWTGQKPY